jgi:hypothetical protein
MLDAVKHYQADRGLTADGWLGPNTLGKLAADVATKNAQNASANQARGVVDITFSGVNRALFGKSVTMGSQRAARVSAPGGLRLRAQPQKGASGTSWVPAAGRVDVLQILPGEKSDPVAPGPGGWAFVRYGGTKGWVPSEWLTPA